jgi:hypothetical protein
MKRQTDTKIRAIRSRIAHENKLSDILDGLYEVRSRVSFLSRAFTRQDDDSINLTCEDSRGVVLVLEDIKSKISTLADELDEENTPK